MLFFQLLLFGGYLYAHLLRSWCSVSQQAIIHIGLLLVALAALPIQPANDWKPQGDDSPTLYLLMLLSVHVGLPYFVLSSTGPLMQAWLSTRISTDRVYRLYALSNAGSLAALLTYPFIVEPMLSVSTQSTVWSWMFGGFVVVQILVAISVGRSRSKSTNEVSSVDSVSSSHRLTPLAHQMTWIGLTALASTLLLTTTNHVCQDIAVIPFLWLLPLSLYLISFIICFDSPKLYHPKLYAALSVAAIALMQLSTWMPSSTGLVVDAAASILFLFFVCILCHGEVARLKPSVNNLTQYYTMMSAGGAIGGLIVAVICPMFLDDFSEQPVTNTLGASLALVLFVAAKDWFGRCYDWETGRTLRLTAILLPLVSIGAAARQSLPGLIESNRNFFGVLRVEDEGGDRCLVHGTTVHGRQRGIPFHLEPTTYYGRQSGIGSVLLSADQATPLKVCGVGLGCGVLASYGREGDRYDFIEINPAVIRVAMQYFTFMDDSKATVVNHLGDGRLVLERMIDRRFDVIALDAFSSDSIPAHLLTREAISLYQSRLTSDGIIAIHVSNKHLDLAPLVHRLAREAGLSSKLVHSEGELENRTLPALWVVVAQRSNPIWSSERMNSAIAPTGAILANAPLWTDQNHNLISVFRAP